MRLDRVAGQSSVGGRRWKSVQAIEANMREKCEVLALLAAPTWRRGGSTNTFWKESVKKMSRKCLVFQICCSWSIGNKFQEICFQKIEKWDQKNCSELCRKWLDVNGVALHNPQSGHFAVTVTSIRNGPITSLVQGVKNSRMRNGPEFDLA